MTDKDKIVRIFWRYEEQKRERITKGHNDFDNLDLVSPSASTLEQKTDDLINIGKLYVPVLCHNDTPLDSAEKDESRLSYEQEHKCS